MKKHLPIIGIALLALLVRLIGLGWDSYYSLHPDERMLFMVVERLSWTEWNPNFVNYGHLPVYILHLISSVLMQIGNTTTDAFTQTMAVGRILSALFDTATVILIFFLAKKLISSNNNRFAYISSGLYAITVFAIQNAHFFTVDTQLTFWIVALFTLCAYMKEITVKNMILFGLLAGASAATKFTGVLSLIIPFLWIVTKMQRSDFTIQRISQLVGYIGITAITATIVFLATQPYIALDLAEYWEQISLQLKMSKDASVFPYTIQFLNTPAYIHPLNDIFKWGLGLIQGSLMLLGLFVVVRKIQDEKNRTLIITTVFSLVFFLILGRSAVKFMRYYLPLYPFFAIISALTISVILDSLKSKTTKTIISTVLILLILAWPIAFFTTYITPHTRIEAGNWMNENLPVGTVIAEEHWDDRLPLRDSSRFTYETLEVYQPDTTKKWSTVKEQLAQSDYLLLSSNRVYRSILHNPDRYPYTSKFYEELFQGTTDYQLHEVFTDFPRVRLGPVGFEVNDHNGAETFTIYDHPVVFLFKNQAK